MQREIASSLAASFPLIPLVSTETAPFQPHAASTASTTAEPSIYAGATTTARRSLTGDKGRYTQSDPLPNLLIAEKLSVMWAIRSEAYAYVRENPVRYSDPLGLLSGASIGPAPFE